MEAVHPYTSAFEGPYCPLNSGGCPATRVTVANSATQANPYVFGQYNKGPRAGRGGLAGGWGGRGNGRILKITGIRASNHQHDQVRVVRIAKRRSPGSRLARVEPGTASLIFKRA